MPRLRPAVGASFIASISRMSRRTIIAGLFLVVAVLGVVWWLADPVPEDGLNRARRALADARRASAEEYAPEEFSRAQAAWDATLVLVRSEGDLIAPLRSFDSVRVQVDRVVEAARRAGSRARHVADSLRGILGTTGRIADEQHSKLERAAGHYPISYVDRDALSRAREYRSHRDAATESGRLFLAVELAQRQQSVLESAQAALEGRLEPVVAMVPRWQESVRRLEASGKTPFVVVDKSARSLYVHRQGRVDSFRVEFGRNWLGPKRVEGDNATPEGEYRVVRRLGRGETSYHRALLIDYPNEADRTRFERARRDGTLPRSARIGGSIELHGGGGRSVDWTDGCVALEDRAMERLFELVPVGTPVLIAGSLTSDLPYVDHASDH